MSAYVVDKAHISAMLRAAQALAMRDRTVFMWYTEQKGELQLKRLTTENADQVGQMLLDENIKSVMYRYEDSEVTDLPGRTNAEYLVPFKYRMMGRTPTPVEALKLCHGFEYQACEHPGWRTSEAHAFVESLIGSASRHVPGYDDAPWEWTDEQEPKNPPILISRLF
jgi:hypothetical protein